MTNFISQINENRIRTIGLLRYLRRAKIRRKRNRRSENNLHTNLLYAFMLFIDIMIFYC